MIELRENLRRIEQLGKDERGNTRRSERIRNRNQVNLVESSEIPKTYSGAKLSKDWPKWEKAVKNAVNFIREMLGLGIS